MSPAVGGFIVWMGACAWSAFAMSYGRPLPWWAYTVVPVVVAYLLVRLLVRRL